MSVELGLSASRSGALCALRLADGTVVAAPASGPASRGTDLVAEVDRLCRRHGVDRRALGAIRIDVGPGSYTGLRVAVTFARLLAAFTAATLAEFTSLELLALAGWRRGAVATEREIEVLLDARRGLVHAGRLRLVDGRVGIVRGPAAGPLDALGPQLAEPALALVAEPSLRPALGRIAARATDLVEPWPELLFDPSLAPRPIDHDAIHPLYLMATYAD